jgi:hypothetical protein
MLRRDVAHVIPFGICDSPCHTSVTEVAFTLMLHIRKEASQPVDKIYNPTILGLNCFQPQFHLLVVR